MTKLYKVTVELESATGLPRDAQQNTWWFDGPDSPSVPQWEQFRSRLVSFYNSWGTSRSQLALSGAGRLLARDTELPAPAEPVYESPITVTKQNLPPLPFDCAAVVTFAAQPVSGIRVQSLRNRIYLGGLTTGPNDPTGRISSSFRTTVATGYNALVSALEADGEFEHVVYSTKRDEVFTVWNAWMDNQWDTQRRRDQKATARSMFW